MIKSTIKLLLKYPIKIANRIFVHGFYSKSLKRDKYEIDNIINKFDKILVFSPHVDDETIGLGATLIKAKILGTQMSLVYMTDGGGSTSQLSRQELVDERKREGQMVKKSYGFKDVYFLQEIDGRLDSTKDELINRIVDILDREKPSVVFTPFLIDGHKDHVETTKSVIRALDKWDNTFDRIYMYEVNCPILPELITDITPMDYDLYNKKGNMYNIFKSQWVMGFEAFKLMDRERRLLVEDKEKAYGAEGFVKGNVNDLKDIEEVLKSENFKPDEFKQLSSEFNVISSLKRNENKKIKISHKVNDILNRKN